MTSISTAENGTKKLPPIADKTNGKKRARKRRNGKSPAVAGKNGKIRAVTVDVGLVMPRLEFAMALEVVTPNKSNWQAVVRDAAEAAGGDLLFVLPGARDATDGEHAMVRLLEGGRNQLLLVRAGETGFQMVEEDAIEAGLARFARASIDVLERIGSDSRVVEPLATLSKH